MHIRNYMTAAISSLSSLSGRLHDGCRRAEPVRRRQRRQRSELPGSHERRLRPGKQTFDSVTAPLQMFSTGGLAAKIKAKLLPWLRVLVVHAQQRGVLVAPWCHCSYGQGNAGQNKVLFLLLRSGSTAKVQRFCFFRSPDGRTFPSS